MKSSVKSAKINVTSTIWASTEHQVLISIFFTLNQYWCFIYAVLTRSWGRVEAQNALLLIVYFPLPKVTCFVDVKTELTHFWWHVDEMLMKYWFLGENVYFLFIFCWGPLKSWSTHMRLREASGRLRGKSWEVWWKGGKWRMKTNLQFELLTRGQINITEVCYY